MRIWVNGGLRDADDARLSVLDHGLTVGDGIFETVRTGEGRPFALTRHLDRLARSARGLGLPDPDLDEVRRAATAVIDANPVTLGRLRITYTGGLSPLGSDRGTAGPSLVVALDGVSRRPDTTAVITVPWTRNERGALTGLKTTSYAENVVALARARERGASEALFPNTVGRLLRRDRVQRVRRAGRPHPHPAGRLRVPRGDHPRAGRGVDRGRGERPSDGGARGGRRDLPDLDAP